jgi:hypothetical protein
MRTFAAPTRRALAALLVLAAGRLSAQQPPPPPDTARTPTVLPEITVEADKYAKPAKYAATTKYDDFFRRRKIGFGTFITRDAIEKMNAFHTHEIIRDVPGVRVSSVSADPEMVRIRLSGCERVAVYIDGRRLIRPTPTPIPAGSGGIRSMGDNTLALMLAQISVPQIEMMEIYRRVAEIPGELNEDACAVIVIWTRWNPERWPGDTLKRARPDSIRPPGWY